MGMTLLLVWLYRSRMNTESLVLWACGATIFIYRLMTFVTIYFYGNTLWWHSVYSDNWNHYYIGIVLVLLSILFKQRLSGKTKNVMLGVGLGMIIDEISDVLKLLPFIHLPYVRDSIQDTLVIIFSYFLFYLLVRFGRNRRSLKS